MDERIARLRTSQDARNLAQNARRLERPELESQALERAGELKAIEEGFTSPAEQAIAAALYAYEDQQTQRKGSTFRANRTRKMLADHGAIAAAERMVLYRRPSKGYEVLEEAGLQALSFEAIIDRFPSEFSAAALAAARARLEVLPPPALGGPKSATSESSNRAVEVALPPVVFDVEALAFLKGSRDPETWFLADWLPRYRVATETFAEALANDRPQDVFFEIWKQLDNGVSNAGQGLLKYESVDEMREELIEAIRDIYKDGDPANFEHIVERFEGWKSEGRIDMVPRLLIARAFAALHPDQYHTTVDSSSQDRVLGWFVERTNFVIPKASSWAARANALVKHLDRANVFEENVLTRNIFPWFVIEQLRSRSAPTSIPPGHLPRSLSAFADLPPAQRVIALRHNALQDALFKRLVVEFGKDKVWTEYPTGTGGRADAIARYPDDRCHLYEIKIADTAAEVVRQAMGQLLEYSFREGGLEPVKLFAVGEPALDSITCRYLDRLRADFKLDIDYLQVELRDETISSP